LKWMPECKNSRGISAGGGEGVMVGFIHTTAGYMSLYTCLFIVTHPTRGTWCFVEHLALRWVYMIWIKPSN
jgi:hypothetical protein